MIDEPVVILGVTFCEKFTFGLSVPKYKHPDELVFELIHTEACVNVPVEVEVFCGKSTLATGAAVASVLLVPLVTAQPVDAPVDRSVFTRV